MGFGKAILGGLDCLPIRFQVAKIFESRAFSGFVNQEMDSPIIYFVTEESTFFAFFPPPDLSQQGLAATRT